MKVRLLTEEEIFGSGSLYYNNVKPGLPVMKRNGGRTVRTDFAGLLSGLKCKGRFFDEQVTPDGVTCRIWSMSSNGEAVRGVDCDGMMRWYEPGDRHVTARVVLPASEMANIHLENERKEIEGVITGEYGEWPQTIVDEKTNARLEKLFREGSLEETGKVYTFDSGNLDYFNRKFDATPYKEYRDQDKKYIRFLVRDKGVSVSGNEVTPVFVSCDKIAWDKDVKTGVGVSEKGLISGLRYDSWDKYFGDFARTGIAKYLNEYFAYEMLPTDEYLKARNCERASAQRSENNGGKMSDATKRMCLTNLRSCRG